MGELICIRNFPELIFDSVGVAVITTDVDGNITSMNPEAEKLTGTRFHEYKGRRLETLLHIENPVTGQQYDHLAELVISKDLISWQQEPAELFPSGSNSVLINGCATRIFDNREVTAGIMLVFRPVSDPVSDKRSEDALRANEERMNFAFRATRDGIWDWNMETNEVFYSSRYKSMLGYGEDEVEPTAEAWKRLLHPDDLERSIKVVEDVIRDKREYAMEFRMLHKDGHYVDILSRGFPIRREPSGPVVRIVGTHFDLTESKKAEMTLKFANQELERAVRLKDEFLAGMSHELRTPLNAILGLSDSMIEQLIGRLNERQIRSMETIRQSGRHLLDLITDILDFSKLESNQVKLDIAPVVVSDVCDAGMIFVRETVKSKNLRLTSQVDPEVTIIHADGMKLRQIVMNLLSNAVKFTPDGGSVELQVKGNKSDGTVMFCVCDTGIGIEPENIPRLFQPFVQLDSGMNRQFAGLGLGLVLVDRLVKLHGGRVTVESKPGQGSRFTVVLPF